MFKEIEEKIKKYDKIIIHHHIQPDGDALGSSFGLQQLIKINFPNKIVYVVGSASGYFDDFFPVHDELKEEDYLDSLSITLDTPNKVRIDGEFYEKSKELVKIDHHLLDEHFGDIEWMDQNCSSTCEMITTLARELNWKIDDISATFLYFGLITDANRFMYGYSENLFDVAKLLVKNNADVKRIYPYIYEENCESVRFHGYCQQAFKTTTNGVAYNKLTPEVLAQFNIPAHQGSGMVNALANMKNIPVWAHFSENIDGTVRAELRSKELPVNTVANIFGGGGHKQASGCTLLNWDEVDDCLNELDKLVYESKPYHNELDVALTAMENAMKLAMSIYNSHKYSVETKEDNSPVTDADKKVDEYLRTYFHNLYPEFGILSEEFKDDKSRLDKKCLWVFDPIDGTKDFVARDDEFAINIALVDNHEVVLGVIGVPAKNIIYYATKNGGAFKKTNEGTKRIFASKRTENLIAVRSKFHQVIEETKYFKQFENVICDVIEIGSAYKMGLIAEGVADVNIKFTNMTKEWDIAPGVIIIKEAGGSFTKPNGEEYIFNREDVYNQEGYIILNKKNKGLFI